MNKHIEEMAKHCFFFECGHCCVDMNKSVMCEDERKDCGLYQTLENLYNAGYRKASDVVREIFGELELKAPFFCANQVAYEHFNEELAELKKKYESEGEDDV